MDSERRTRQTWIDDDHGGRRRVFPPTDPVPFRRPSELRLDSREEEPSALVPDTSGLVESCRRFSTVELCLAWQQTFLMDDRTRDPRERLRNARIREAFLDEFERRDPDALHAWLTSAVSPRHAPIAFFGPEPRGLSA